MEKRIYLEMYHKGSPALQTWARDWSASLGHPTSPPSWTLVTTSGFEFIRMDSEALDAHAETAEADAGSIMCYQIPGEITVDGQAIVGGVDIDRLVPGKTALKIWQAPIHTACGSVISSMRLT